MFVVKIQTIGKRQKYKCPVPPPCPYAHSLGVDAAYNLVCVSFHIKCVCRMYIHHKNRYTLRVLL